MGVIDGKSWMEHLSPDECWQLLALSPVGRIGVLVDGAPEIYPVNFIVDKDAVVFRTDPNLKQRGLDDGSTVCFESDGLDVDARAGWSVLIKGQAEELHGPEERRVAELPLHSWTAGELDSWVRVVPGEVTGRRIWNL